MNRVIKFRAWDSEKKIMYIPIVLSFVENKVSSLILCDDGNRKYIDHKLMQFTGLKDANGKEIYEDDIVSLREAKRKYVVKFYKGCFKLFHADPKLNDMIWGSIERVDELGWAIEVIGNIHENPELI